jgi:rSAM/selenodomain-associated transferase 2
VYLSIIVPTLEEGEQVLACVKHLAPLRAAGHELILVDGGSKALAREALAPWVDRLLVCEPGRARQMNQGAQAAHGEVLWFLHADTRMGLDADRAIADALAGQPGWGRFDVRLNGRHSLLRLVERMMNLRSRWSGIATGDQGLFIHRELFHQVGGYPDQALMEDVEISARLKRLRPPHCLRQRLLTSSRRWERQGVVKTVFLMWGLRFAYWLGVSPNRLARYYRSCPTAPS